MVTAQRAKRNKNVGIIKMMGGGKNKIIQMIATESVIQVFMAFILTVILISVTLPFFNNLTSLNYTLSELFSVRYFALFIVILVFMILITGFIPGIIFSKKMPLGLVRQQKTGKGNNTSRNGLLVFQFIVTITLIASILVVNKQTNHLQNQELGLDKSNIIYANTNDAIYDNVNALKNELKRIPGIIDYTFSENVLVDNSQNWGRSMENKGERIDISFSKLSVSPNFFEFFGIKLKEGRGFNENSTKKQEHIFNQTARDEFQVENLQDARVVCSKAENGEIVGIVEDYNFESLHVPIRAAGFMCSGDCDGVIYLKINAKNSKSLNNTITRVEQTWNQLSPDFPFEYNFLDKKWETHYQKDKQFQTIISYTTFISILLSCLGLIGLTFFVMEQRIKEIGIRKVNGAKVREVLAMLNKDFVKWVAIAFIVACPIAYYAMNKWLENFAYKTVLSWWVFALAGVLALGIALLTVSWQSWRAATRNPVEALRYE